MWSNWTNIPLSPSFRTDVPSVPGVYALVDVNRFRGLPVNVKPIYFGQSRNLLRRFMEHAVGWKESNPLLVAARGRAGGLEFFFRRVPTDQLDAIEREMIRELEPPANRIKYAQQGERS